MARDRATFLKTIAAFNLLLFALVLAACGGGKKMSNSDFDYTPAVVRNEPDAPRIVETENYDKDTKPLPPFVLNRVYFDFDKHNLGADALQSLSENARMLMVYPDVKIVLEGHCDERGTVNYNLALGERRARAVRDYLVSFGIRPERLSVISYGKEKPLVSRNQESAWSKNRRVEFVNNEKLATY
jgi:peptidoglycan-associated lipoprotein